MIPATISEQQQLFELQRVDLAIRQLHARRSSLPEQQALDENAATLEKISGEFADVTQRVEQLQASQRRLESEIATVDSRRKSEEGRMYSGLITSEKEVEALRNELQSLRSRKRDLEDNLLEVMEELESLESLVATLKERNAELRAKVDELTTARDHAAGDIDAELREREDERAKVALDISAELREYYDDLAARKQGVAVAALERRSCSGCRLELTAIELEEIKETVQRGLAKCQQCDRILVVPAQSAG